MDSKMLCPCQPGQPEEEKPIYGEIGGVAVAVGEAAAEFCWGGTYGYVWWPFQERQFHMVMQWRSPFSLSYYNHSHRHMLLYPYPNFPDFYVK
jgi:hypothetical protein